MKTMNAVLRENADDSDRDQVNSTLRVVVLYEDQRAGQHAKGFCDRLADRLHYTVRFCHSLWRFDMLALPALTDTAAGDVIQADLVVIAGHADNALPPVVSDCLKRWLPQKASQVSALVALFEASDDTAANLALMQEHLQTLASAAGMDFFIRPTPAWIGEEPPQPATRAECAGDRGPVGQLAVAEAVLPPRQFCAAC